MLRESPTPTISVLIPAYNEEPRIGETLRAVPGAPPGYRRELIVVDDGSRDATAHAAEASGADVVHRQSNSGKGAALNAAGRIASGEVLLLLDADLGATASEASKLLDPVIAGAADMTIATFPMWPGRGGGMGIAVRAARWGIRLLTGRSMAAPLSGQRAVTRGVVEACGGFAEGWGVEIALTVRAIWAGCRVLEVATEMDHRVTGRSVGEAFHRAAQLRAVLWVVAGLWWSQLRSGKPRQAVDRPGA